MVDAPTAPPPPQRRRGRVSMEEIWSPMARPSWPPCRHRRGACRGGHGRLDSTRPTSPPLGLYIGQQTLIDECPLSVFFTLFGCGGGVPKGAGAQSDDAVFQPRQLKNGNFRNWFFFDTLPIQNDQISYVKHVSSPLIYVFSTLIRVFSGGGGGVPRGLGQTTCLCSFIASAAQKWWSLSPLQGALPKVIEFFEIL